MGAPRGSSKGGRTAARTAVVRRITTRRQRKRRTRSGRQQQQQGGRGRLLLLLVNLDLNGGGEGGGGRGGQDGQGRGVDKDEEDFSAARQAAYLVRETAESQRAIGVRQQGSRTQYLVGANTELRPPDDGRVAASRSPHPPTTRMMRTAMPMKTPWTTRRRLSSSSSAAVATTTMVTRTGALMRRVRTRTRSPRASRQSKCHGGNGISYCVIFTYAIIVI